MATKKAAPKKAAPKAAKSPAKNGAARPAVKAAAKPSKTSSKPAVKAAPKKAAPVKAAAKAAPARKAAPVKAAAPKKAAPAKAAPKAVKSAPPKAAPKAAPAKAGPAPAKAAPKAAPKATPKAPAPAPKKAAEPIKKPAVSAPSTPEVKPAIKPLAQPAKKAAEPKKPFVIPKTTTTKSVKYDPEFTKSVLDSGSGQNQEAPRPAQRYSDADLTEFRELINRKLETAKKELLYLQGLITRKDEGGDLDEGRYMTLEDGSMSMEREQLSQMASRQIQFIDHLEKAIMRIENKTYGICRVTGKLIDKARLRAVPHATLSIEAKQMMNK